MLMENCAWHCTKVQKYLPILQITRYLLAMIIRKKPLAFSQGLCFIEWDIYSPIHEIAIFIAKNGRMKA
jgi:hypothetical protein